MPTHTRFDIREREATGGRLTPADEGKRVVTPNGEPIGSVVRIRPSGVLVRPKRGLLHGCGSWITGGWRESSLFELDRETVFRVTDEAIVLLPPTVGREQDAREIGESSLTER